MSIAEYGGPTTGEINLLLVARAQLGSVCLDGGPHEAEARAMAKRLVERGYGEMFANERGEFFRPNTAGVRCLANYLTEMAPT